MNHIGLFEGIGGFSVAAHAVGWNTIAWCEINKFGQSVLLNQFPDAKAHEDITKTDFTIYRGKCDIITGGFPCQDASIAKQYGNSQQGLKGERTGLFYEMVRAIEEIRPKYIVAENVENILRTNNGRDFQAILSEFSRMGYNAEWRACRASEVGACHHRSRLYLVAYSNSLKLKQNESFFCYVVKEVQQKRRVLAGTTSSVGTSWDNEPEICLVDDGISCKLDGITFSKWRQETIKAGGNAIVPQVAIQIFKAINAYHKIH